MHNLKINPQRSTFCPAHSLVFLLCRECLKRSTLRAEFFSGVCVDGSLAWYWQEIWDKAELFQHNCDIFGNHSTIAVKLNRTPRHNCYINQQLSIPEYCYSLFYSLLLHSLRWVICSSLRLNKTQIQLVWGELPNFVLLCSVTLVV